MFGIKTAFFLAITIGFVMAGTTAYAGEKTKLKDITCEQFLAMDDDNQSNIVYWVEGAAVASSKKSVAAEDVEVGYDIFGRPVAEVVTACEADKKASLWDKIKAHF
jgi:hypothetical protein